MQLSEYQFIKIINEYYSLSYKQVIFYNEWQPGIPRFVFVLLRLLRSRCRFPCKAGAREPGHFCTLEGEGSPTASPRVGRPR